MVWKHVSRLPKHGAGAIPIIFMRHHNNRWSVEWVTKTGAHHSRGGFTHYDRALNYLNAKRKLHPDWEYKGLVR